MIQKKRLHATQVFYCFTKLLVPICLLLLLKACSSHHVPAPVISLSTKTASPQNLTQITTDTYTVELGDTLFAIAFYSGNDYRELAKLNNISPPYTIKLGQTLLLRPPVVQEIASTSIAKHQTSPALEPKHSSQAHKQTGAQQTKTMSGPKAIPKQQAPSYDKPTSWIWPATGDNTIATVGNDGGTRGVDIKGKLGSPVVAAASGKVVYAGNALKGYGNLIIIKHDSDYLSAYAHNSAILVREQSFVRQGQTIATMGNTGASEVMLHFEIRKKGKSINPLKYLPSK